MSVWGDMPGFPGRAHEEWRTTDPRDREDDDREGDRHPTCVQWQRWCRDNRVTAHEEWRAWRGARLAHVQPPRADSALWARITDEHMDALKAAIRDERVRAAQYQDATGVLRAARFVAEGARILSEGQIEGDEAA